jgi:hypothetical protein
MEGGAGAMLDFSIALAINEVNEGCWCRALCNWVGLERVQPFIEAQFTCLQAKPSHCNKNTSSCISQVCVAMIDLPAAGSVIQCILKCQSCLHSQSEAPGCKCAWFKTLAFSLENQQKNRVFLQK